VSAAIFPPLAMRTLLAATWLQPCLLCDSDEPGGTAALFSPNEQMSRELGVPDGKQRTIGYRLCNRCAAAMCAGKAACAELIERVEGEIVRRTRLQKLTRRFVASGVATPEGEGNRIALTPQGAEAGAKARRARRRMAQEMPEAPPRPWRMELDGPSPPAV